VVGELKAAQGAGAVPVPGAALPGARGAQPQPEAGGIFSPGSTVAGYELQKAAAQQTLAQEGEAAKETEAAQAQLARLTEMQQALDRIPVGGNFSKVYEGIDNALNYAGIKVPGLAAIQEYSKYRTNFVADAARKMGAKVSYQEVGYIAKGVPDFTLAVTTSPIPDFEYLPFELPALPSLFIIIRVFAPLLSAQASTEPGTRFLDILVERPFI
jgi:hypothetical protein